MSRKAIGNYGLYLGVSKPSCLEGFLKGDGLGWWGRRVVVFPYTSWWFFCLKDLMVNILEVARSIQETDESSRSFPKKNMPESRGKKSQVRLFLNSFKSSSYHLYRKSHIQSTFHQTQSWLFIPEACVTSFNCYWESPFHLFCCN